MRGRSFRILGLLLGVLSSTAPAEPKVIDVDLTQARPTQMQIGLAAVDAIEKDDRAKLKPDETLESRITAKLKEKPPTAVIGPGPQIYVIDGHHRTLEAYRLHAKDPAILGKIPMKIEADFSKDEGAFYAYMARTNAGYFTAEVRERARGIQPPAARFKSLYQSLPADFGALARSNSPERSVVGKAFYDIGVKSMSPPFVNYVEFYLAEELRCYLAAKPGHEFDPETLLRARLALFKNPDTLAYLETLALPDHAEEALEIVKKAQEAGAATTGPEPKEWAACRAESARRAVSEALSFGADAIRGLARWLTPPKPESCPTE